ncbi:MAG: putative toxin-antitoxin system toxin component, PIN family [Clostridia bacterium]|nr:putative toxin-antitoxin system toxin component, PIN family [Clostridia bacterium]
MICYAVIDTNVLVSALLSSKEDAATVRVLERMLSGDIIPVYTNEMISEYCDVLTRKKFGFDADAVNYLIAAIEKYGIMVKPHTHDIVRTDMNDLPFYEAVLEKREDNAYLVTGNLKHFPHEPFVITAAQMIEILEAK